MSFEEIVMLEPRIGELLREAEEAARCGEQADDLYARYKARLGRLVGWHAANEKLRDPRYYETVMRALCAALDY